MPSLPVVMTALREVLTLERAPRVVEPDLVMADPEKTKAFEEAGQETGVMASMYLFNCAQVCEVLRPGDVVVDLGCGPAIQLAMIARLNPEVQFIGVDLSESMLARARAHVAAQGLANVTFRRGDITQLGFLRQGQANVAVSTMALHHLPDTAALERACAEVARLLAPGGAVCLIDFGHLKSEKSIEYFATNEAERQPELFTQDYWASLRAAFRPEDFERAAARLHPIESQVLTSFAVPFLMAIKSKARPGAVPESLRRELWRLREALPPRDRTNFEDLRAFCRLGGLRTALFD